MMFPQTPTPLSPASSSYVYFLCRYGLNRLLWSELILIEIYCYHWLILVMWNFGSLSMVEYHSYHQSLYRVCCVHFFIERSICSQWNTTKVTSQLYSFSVCHPWKVKLDIAIFWHSYSQSTLFKFVEADYLWHDALPVSNCHQFPSKVMYPRPDMFATGD